MASAQNPWKSLLDPFERYTQKDIHEHVDELLRQSHLHTFACDLRRGALLAQNKFGFQLWERTEKGEAPFAGDATSAPEITSFEQGHLSDEQGIDPGQSPHQSDSGSRASRDATTDGFGNTKAGSSLRQYFYQKSTIHALVACCSLGAAIQGWDETAVNGAQVIYQETFGISPNSPVLGLINSAPYLMCMCSCLLTEPLNTFLGRKGTIIFTCLFSFASCLGQAFVKNKWQLFICRLLLGLGIGPKTATIPIYAAESVPQLIRGAMVMQWQLWTALGIMAGLVTSYIFRNAGASWRLMLGSPMIPAAVLLFLMFSMPESPRWHLLKVRTTSNSNAKHHHYEQAFLSLWRLRHTKLQAGRDLVLLDKLIDIEMKVAKRRRGASAGEQEKVSSFHTSLVKYKALWSNMRCRRAMVATLIVMVLQQLCGLNVLAYYSSSIFLRPPTEPRAHCAATNPVDSPETVPAKDAIGESFGLSMGLGAANFGLALPALLLIDTLGRRALLLFTFPLMSTFYFATAFAFFSKNCDLQRKLVISFCYLFMAAYSVGEGPVPLVYAAESLPLALRDSGIGIATALYWGFNFMIAMTWPPFNDISGLPYRHGISFGFYAVLCLVGFFLILFFVPETKRLELEQLDVVFSFRYSFIMRHGKHQLFWILRRFACMNAGPFPRMFPKEGTRHSVGIEPANFDWPWTDDVETVTDDQSNASGTLRIRMNTDVEHG